MMEFAHEAGYHEEAGRLVEQVYRSTDAMIRNLVPHISNEEAFQQDFYQNWNIPSQEFNKFFDNFYERGFPQLKKFTRPFPGIPEMMEKVFARGFKVVVATNAVFPLKLYSSVLIGQESVIFLMILITSFELMHYCKPHPQYYQEIAQYIGVSPEHCLMVGNDIGEDLPAGTVGMKTFLVENLLIDKGHSTRQIGEASCRDLYKFIDTL
jgi:FMN phosphatase YigB (HAD superfamily)